MLDIQQLDIVFWDAWASLEFQSLENQQSAASPTRSQKKNKRQRETDRANEDVKRRRSERQAHVGQKCPHAHCVGKTRRFAQLNGLFSHMYV